MNSTCDPQSNRSTPPCFALLDDCGEAARSRLYTGHRGSLSCRGAAEFDAMLNDMQAELNAGLHAVALFRYELGAEPHGVDPRETNQALAEVLLFEKCELLSQAQVADWLAASGKEEQDGAGIAQIRASVNETAFNAALARIREYIEAGDVYQINYTYRLRFDAYGSPRALYRRLRARQPVPYGALIALPDGRSVLSLSPELFVQQANGIAQARPMKGTAAAGADARQDAERAAALAADPKNRAENLMIVDLLRNDLGRVAAPGSVRVPSLFDVTRFSDVLQMTSTVEARLRDDAGLGEVLRALYPCGSITGAPKRRAMQIIRELEPDARGVYTGAIGWFEAPSAANPIGDFCLSVPIRTLVLDALAADGKRSGEMGIGAGIVHDSAAAAEYAECRLKAQFLTGLKPEFELFETMHATRTGCRHMERHLRRLRASADYFGFVFDEAAILAALREACAALPSDGAFRLRLALDAGGGHRILSAPLTPLREPVRLRVADQATRADDLFLRHKSTVRARYDAAWRTAEVHGAFDMLFFNTDGELTEGGRSNVFLRQDRQWFTPPLAAGVLPGVMRAVLLDDPKWNASERWLSLGDLLAADEIVVCNALRGVLRARLDFPA